MPPKKSSGSDSGDKRREEERALEKMDLFEAIESGDIKKVEKYVKSGADVNM